MAMNMRGPAPPHQLSGCPTDLDTLPDKLQVKFAMLSISAPQRMQIGPLQKLRHGARRHPGNGILIDNVDNMTSALEHLRHGPETLADTITGIAGRFPGYMKDSQNNTAMVAQSALASGPYNKTFSKYSRLYPISARYLRVMSSRAALDEPAAAL